MHHMPTRLGTEEEEWRGIVARCLEVSVHLLCMRSSSHHHNNDLHRSWDVRLRNQWIHLKSCRLGELS